MTINGSGTITGLVAGGLPDGTIVGSDLAAGTVSETTYRSTTSVQKFSFGNAAPNQQPYTTSFTLSAAEAPIGSYVILSLWLSSGNSAGQQYCYVHQRNSASANPTMGGFITAWYYNHFQTSLFYIADAADRTFAIVHGTISFSNNNDFRAVRYHGFIKVTQ